MPLHDEHLLSDNHGSSDEPPSKRQRLASSKVDGRRKSAPRRKKACQTCRIRKIKCDAVRPECSLCKTTGATCEYLEAEAEGPGPLTLDSATEILCKRLDTIQNLLGFHLDRQQTESARFCSPYLNEQTTIRDDLSQVEAQSIFEPSKDFLQIPAQKTAADTILTWPVFETHYDANSIIEVLFRPGQGESAVLRSPPVEPARGLDEVKSLVDKFLQNVHTKNPILDVELLLEHARDIAANGFGHDGYSCIVYLACALGCVAKPFSAATEVTETHYDLVTESAVERQGFADAETFFAQACQLLGALQPTVIGVQCHFYAGVYLMYTLRPLRSWQYFINASTLYTMFEKMNHGPAGRLGESLDESYPQYGPDDDKKKRLEQSLYWSCFKSESEFRIELPLPLTEIGSFQHPRMFPTPPSSQISHTTEQATADGQTTSSSAVNGSDGHSSAVEYRAHVKALCSEEESWYYYLTEIALRRIGNRIVNTFFRDEPINWLNIRPLLRIALEFDSQVSSWSAHLPPAMQHWESTYSIRAPNQKFLQNRTSHVSRELSWAIENRLLEIQSWLYQPFLYYLIHHTHGAEPCDVCSIHNGQPNASPLLYRFASNSTLPEGHSREDTSALQHLIASGVECNLTILDNRSLLHRHHGLWFDLRSLMGASLILLGIVRNGHEAFIPGGAEVLWGSKLHRKGGGNAPIEGKIGLVLARFTYWSTQSPDMLRHREILEQVTRRVCSLVSAGRPGPILQGE